MDAPVQASPMPRRYMQDIVGRDWAPDALDMLRDVPRRRERRGKKAANPCLIQLTTFVVCRRRKS